MPFVAALAIGTAAPAQAQGMKPSKAQQVQLGKKAAEELRQKERVLSSGDPRVQTLRRVARRLLSAVDDRNEPWEYSFDVIDNRQVNAFALPGGPIFFYTGILEKMRTEDELAGVLAHELVHIRREHWAYNYRDSQTRNLGLSLLLVFTRANRDVANIAGLGSSLLTLKYSRNHETQSDNEGFDMMVKAGYNPQGMADVFAMLRDQSRGGRPPEFLSSHPNDNNRIRNIEARIQRSNRNFPAQRPLNFSRSGQRDDYYGG